MQIHAFEVEQKFIWNGDTYTIRNKVDDTLVTLQKGDVADYHTTHVIELERAWNDGELVFPDKKERFLGLDPIDGSHRYGRQLGDFSKKTQEEAKRRIGYLLLMEKDGPLVFDTYGIIEQRIQQAHAELGDTDAAPNRTTVFRWNKLWVIPVLVVTVPSDPSPKKLLGALLRALGDPAPEKGDQWGRLLLLVRSCGVKIIIIDEIQHLVDKGRKKTHAQAADKLKELEEALGVPMVFVGAPRAEELFMVNSQLRSRAQTTFYMRPFYTELAHGGDGEEYDDQCNSSENQDEVFRAFLEALMRQTHFKNTDFFDVDERRLRCFYATDGIQRTIYRVIRFANTMFAQEKTLSNPILEKVFSKRVFAAAAPRQNPFSSSFEMRRLTQFGEPYVPSPLDGDNHNWRLGRDQQIFGG